MNGRVINRANPVRICPKSNVLAMNLNDLGFTEQLAQFRADNQLDQFETGRIITQHKTIYILKNTHAEYEAELLGNLRYNAASRKDLPVVGDWVAFSIFDENKALIHAVYPRSTMLERQAVGKVGEKQIIAANIDVGLILQAIDRDFSVNRLERYLTLCHTAGIEPIVLITKIDLIDEEDLNNIQEQISSRLKDIQIVSISNKSKLGYDHLKTMIKKGKTYCLLGSSGVGKSSLINGLAGNNLMQTGDIGSSSNRGKHVTTHRELFILINGAILIDNPGMREVGLTEEGKGLELTFDLIEHFAEECRFRDCQHLDEVGCAVVQAVKAGEVDLAAFENYQKLQREKAHFERSVAEKRKQDKAFGKMVKQMKKNKRDKY